MFRFDERRIGCASHGAELEEEVTTAIDAARLGLRLGRALEELDHRDRQIIVRHYFGGDTLNDIGRDLGRSRSWACRVHSRALARLRSALEPALCSMSASPTAAAAAGA